MSLNRTSLLTEYRLVARFDDIRDRLISTASAAQLSKPLAFWVLPTDRRLPLAFMGRSLKDLLSSSFEALMETPGVGQKKMVALVSLLERAAANLDQAEMTLPIVGAAESLTPSAYATTETGEFDPGQVSEAVWSNWCRSIKQYHLEQESLGRFSPCLQNMPRVLWNTPLSAYCDHTLEEIRHLKTHGEKRVAGVIEVFHEIHKVLSGLGSIGALAVRVQPRIAGQIENWLLAVLERTELPSPEELTRQVVVPLIDQARHDLGDAVAQLLEDRLGLRGDEASVRQTARNLGLTRARIYQLLADVAEVISVRWPEGQYLINHLAERIRRETQVAGYEQFLAMVELLFPHRRGLIDQKQAAQAEVELPPHRRAG